MIDAGELEPAAAQGHAWRNIILRCLGRETPLEVGIAAGSLKPDELLLLCSDGLTEEVDDGHIAQVLAHIECSAQECVDGLIAAALDGGGSDNVTAILVRSH